MALPSELGKCVSDDDALLSELGWVKFVQRKRGTGDLGTLDLNHPAKRLLQLYKERGAPAKMQQSSWSPSKLKQALSRGPHKSCYEFLDFLQQEFVDMISKGQWVILPFDSVKHLPGLRLSPPGCVPQRDRRPRWICDYTFSGVNEETLELFAKESMQFGHALDRLLREILLADPKLGETYLIKVDISDGFYRINLNIEDIPKLGVVFPTEPGCPPLVALPLVLPMGWKNSPPIFTTGTETVADVANANIRDPTYTPPPHHLDKLADSIPIPAPPPKPSQLDLLSRDPSLPQAPIQGYVDVFMDDFLALVQGTADQSRVRSTLMHAIDTVFRPLNPQDNPNRQEPISLKKLRKGDCTWSTNKQILGWILDTVAQTIELPPHRIQRLAEILDSVPPTQKRIGVTKWHQILGELRSMALALPGSRHLFGHMQHAFTTQKGSRLALKKGVHQSIQDFKWLLKNIADRPTRIAEIVPLLASALGHHDASAHGAGGVWFVADHVPNRKGYHHRPVVWRFQWPKAIKDQLVTEHNPNGSITNSDLELAGGLLHLQAIAQSFDTRERTILSKTDNLATLFWQRKGSATTTKCPHYLLRLFGIHQRYHRYVPRHDYLSGPSNPIADALSRHFQLSNSTLLHSLNTHHKQKQPFQLVQLEPAVLSSVISALQTKLSKPESLLVAPAPPLPPGNNGKPSVLKWPSIPFSKPSKTKYQCYKSLPNVFGKELSQSKDIPSALDHLRITYGALHRRSSVWGPKTPGSIKPTKSTSDSSV